VRWGACAISLHNQNNPLQVRALQSVRGASVGVREYRLRVVASLPWLRELDFSALTRSELEQGRAMRAESRARAAAAAAAAPSATTPSPLPTPLCTMLGRSAGGRPRKKA
jgi:hypothetical protein